MGEWTTWGAVQRTGIEWSWAERYEFEQHRVRQGHVRLGATGGVGVEGGCERLRLWLKEDGVA
jgi:hypothetical protein